MKRFITKTFKPEETEEMDSFLNSHDCVVEGYVGNEKGITVTVTSYGEVSKEKD